MPQANAEHPLIAKLEMFPRGAHKGSRDAILDVLLQEWGGIDSLWRKPSQDERIVFLFLIEKPNPEEAPFYRELKSGIPLQVSIAFLTHMLENEIPDARDYAREELKRSIPEPLASKIDSVTLNDEYQKNSFVLHAFFPIRTNRCRLYDPPRTDNVIARIGPNYLFNCLTAQLADELDWELRDGSFVEGNYKILEANPELSEEAYFEKLIDKIPPTYTVYVVVYGIETYLRYGRIDEAKKDDADEDRKSKQEEVRKAREDEVKKVFETLWRIKTKLQAQEEKYDEEKSRLPQGQTEEERAKNRTIRRDKFQNILGPELKVLVAGPGSKIAADWIPEDDVKKVWSM